MSPPGSGDATARVCYNMTVFMRGDFWHAETPTNRSLPSLNSQLVIVMLVTRILMVAFKPLHQPRIVADILGGVLVGPSVIGGINFARAYIAPFHNFLTIETIASLGLLYYMFMVGLELDFKPVKRAGKKALSIALAGLVVTVPLGAALHYFLLGNDSRWKYKGKRPTRYGPLVWGITLGTTSFLDLARILADLKLLHSEVGRLALSAAVIAELCSWFLLVVTMSVMTAAGWRGFATTVAFVVVCVFVLRPALLWAIRCKFTENKKNNNNDMDLNVCFVLFGVVIFGFITQTCGSHFIVGPFVLGAIMPKKGEMKKMVMQRIQNYVYLLMMPLFFLFVGLRTDFRHVVYEDVENQVPYGAAHACRVMVVIVLSSASKIFTTFLVALIHKIQPWDSFTLGILMNTKGLLGLIILNSAKDLQVLDHRTFAVMMSAIWLMTVPVGPFLALGYKTTRASAQYKIRNIQSLEPDTELRILTYTHTSTNVSGIVDLLEASNPSRQSWIYVFAVQLVELTGQASAMLIVHDACKANTNHTWANTEAQPESFTSRNAFESYAKGRANVYVQALTTVSAYNTMHEDICNLAEEKCINLIIIPFHMQANIDGAMEDANPSLKGINNNVIEKAPCSLAVFVDRGLSMSHMTESCKDASQAYRHFAMFFIGGADDREALTYAWRMAGNPRVNLKVVRFIVTPNNNEGNNKKETDPKVMEDSGREKQIDELYVDQFRLKSEHNPNIQFLEEAVNSWEQTLNLIRELEGEYDLYIVGRRHGSTSPAKAFSDHYLSQTDDQLGPLGEALLTSSFAINASILVVQQGAAVDEPEDENVSVI
ncbi:unnamed protein product [Prunus armeniaca]|uniref:Cation/H+ exchanger domain-containing protein n=1 Tax=Prunus armeniaca TaxID=36596 RepID=A0A6J5WKP5_PRUAR|nr:unnamed protein product [Prunus armeniaca]